MSLIVDIEKDYGSFKLKIAVEAQNETLALLGASGCGKSLTLRCIAGIEKPDRGYIEVNGRTLFDSKRKIDLSPQERRTGLMFQNYALFPNMNVLQNIRCGAKREKNKDKREENVQKIMERFGLAGLAEHLPSQLSGGQQQRAALARILVSEPEILLLDEPFSALDSHLRFRLESELRQVIKNFGKTVVLVSHDRDEVFRLSDSIAVVNSGHVENVGLRHQVYSDPKTRNAARLTGCKNISAIRRISEHCVEAVDWGISLEVNEGRPDADAVGIRAHELSMDGDENRFDFRIADELENPFSCTLILKAEGSGQSSALCWEISKELRRSISGDRISLCLPREKLLLLSESKKTLRDAACCS